MSTLPRHQLDAQRTDSGPLLEALTAAGATINKPSAICCPYHPDTNPSAGIFRGDDGAWRFKCQVCGVHGDVYDIRQRNGEGTLGEQVRATMPKLEPPKMPPPTPASKPPKTYATVGEAQQALLRFVQSVKGETYRQTAEWVYRWQGDEYARVLRFDGIDGKTFRPLRVVSGGYQIGDPQTWHPYRVDELPNDATVYIVEGEKAADALWSIGIPATTSAHGAKSARNTNWSSLKGRNVVIWPDRDEPGNGYASEVAALLTKAGDA
jgi:putative DNA primase/helicase